MKGELILDGEYLYRYIKPNSFPEDQIEVPHSIFANDKEMSCDWAKIQSYPEYSYHITEGKNLILRISVCDDIRNPCNPKVPEVPQPQWHQDIIHDPIAKGEDLTHPDVPNPSHSLIRGEKKIHVTKAIARNCEKFKTVDPQNLPPLVQPSVSSSAMSPIKFFPALILALFIIGLIALLLYLSFI